MGIERCTSDRLQVIFWRIALGSFDKMNRISDTMIRPASVARTRTSNALKQAMDTVLTILLLPLAGLLIGILALWIKLDDGGPCFYRRRVIGRYGEFDAFKLRTMRVDADEVLNRNPELRREFEKNFKLRTDPRVTRLGKILRKTSLDELPQLFNVLKGQMSLVGPRMIVRSELEKYGAYADLLLSVKPGLTGYWQVNGRQEVSYEERVKMDVYYIQNWSLWLDFKILLQTAWKLIRHEGAY